METVAGLNIGSSYIVAAVAAVSDERSSVKGFPAGLKMGFSRSAGYRRGVVTDAESLTHSVKEALEMAEEACGQNVEAAYIGFSGHTVEINSIKSGSETGKARRITQRDVERSRRLALVSEMPADRRVIQVFPVKYIPDGIPRAGDPSGMVCSGPDFQSLVVTADNELIEQLAGVVRAAGLRALDFLPSPLAAGESVLTGVQHQLGACVVDIGGSCTSVVLYRHGYPAGYAALPVGSDHITSDLAICLRTSLEAAEEIKRNIGLGGADVDSVISVPRLSGIGDNEVSAKHVVSIIEARAGELLDMIGSAVAGLSGGLNLPGGLVFTGGGSAIKGLEKLASGQLGMKVQLGLYNGSQNTGVRDNDGKGAGCGPDTGVESAVGLLKYFTEKRRRAEQQDVHQPASGFWGRVKGILREPKWKTDNKKQGRIT
ncbi:MAG: cell division protein FtsA [Bacillota bacterium]